MATDQVEPADDLLIPDSFTRWPEELLRLLTTAVAVSLGTPLWFDPVGRVRGLPRGRPRVVPADAQATGNPPGPGAAGPTDTAKFPRNPEQRRPAAGLRDRSGDVVDCGERAVEIGSAACRLNTG